MSASFPQRPPSAGLVNLGNSCFASAVIQSLFLTDAFRSLLTGLRLSPSEMQRYGVLRSLQHLFGLLLFGVRSEYRPAGFLSSLPERFHNGSQQDADEFAKFLLDAVSSSIADIHKQRGAAGKRKADEMEAGETETAEEERKQPQPLRDPAQRSVNSISLASAAESSSGGAAMTDAGPAQVRPSQGKIFGGAQSSPLLSAAAAAISSVPPSPLPAFSVARSLPASSAPAGLVSPPAVPVPAFCSAAVPQHDVDANFGGLARSTITCLRCGLQSVKDEAFLELPLPMQQMDTEQRRQLEDSIHRAREEAQRPQPTQQHAQQTVNMEVEEVERTHGQQKVEAEKARTVSSAVPEQPNLPLDVLARIAQFASPLALPLSRSLRSAHSAQPHHVAAAAHPTASHTSPAAASSTRTAPPFSSSPAAVSPTVVSAVRPAVIPSSSSPLPSASAAAAVSLPRVLSSTDRLNSSAMQDSHISSVMSPSSASVFLPASSSSFSSTAAQGDAAAKLLAACLAQFALQAQALTSVATLTTAAAIAQKVKSSWEEQQSAEAEKAEKEATAAAAARDEQCTALVIYAPPPHSQLTAPSASGSDPAAASPLSNAADGFSLVGSTSSSSAFSSSSSSSASLLHLPAMLELYLSPELLAGADAYHCSHCASKQAATKALTVQSPPPHLLICLKRNEYHTDSGTRTKILTEVKFPCILHLPVTASAPASATISASASSAASTSACTYALYSVVVHSGLNADSGHYYAIGRWSGQLRRRMREELRRRGERQQAQVKEEREAEAAAWLRLAPELEEEARAGDFFLFNDSSVTAASFSTIAQVTKRQQQDVAYLLFYVRLDGEAEGDRQEQEAVDPLLAVNPMLRKLAELEQLSFRRQQEKAVREAVQAAMQTLPKMPAYDTAAMQDYTDPDQ